MSATEIIRESARLPLAEEVVHRRRPLSGAELTVLAERMVNASEPAEADRLQEALVKGFYGED